MSEARGVELVAVGTELMVGETVESNGSWLCRRLAEEGLAVLRRTIVGDDPAAIRSAVGDALGRAGGVLVTGGLGPTQDDLTRPAVAALYGWPLDIDTAWLEVIRARFAARGRAMPESNRAQAEVPRGARLLANDLGTAPGLLLDDPDRGWTVLLPGVPAELHHLVERHVIAFLRERMPGRRGRIAHRVVRTTGLPESEVGERVADVVATAAPLTIAFLPVGIGIDLRITTWGDLGEAEAEAALDRVAAALRQRLGPWVYGAAGDDLAAVVGQALRDRGATIALAESCTGGLVARRLTETAGSSDYFLAAIVAYSNEAKSSLLGVAAELIDRHGAVSEAVASAMLDGALRASGAQAGISVTGVAGPGGGTAEKPVGTVWIGCAFRDQRSVVRYSFHGTRAEVRARAAQAALAQLLGLVRKGANPS